MTREWIDEKECIGRDPKIELMEVWKCVIVNDIQSFSFLRFLYFEQSMYEQ